MGVDWPFSSGEIVPLANLINEIERLRGENDKLKVRIGTYYAGNADGGIVKRLEAEIERLRGELTDMTDQRDIFKRTLDKRDYERDELRQLLRETLARISPFTYWKDRGPAEDFEKRVREALGDE
jgi:hypothetical protein